MGVKIYTTKTCGFCKLAKEFLIKNKIIYTEMDVTNDQSAAQEMIDKSGQMGVPVLVIDGQVIIGFDKEKIKKALKLP